MQRAGLLRFPPALALALAACAAGGGADGSPRAAAEHLRQHGVTDHPQHAAAERAAAARLDGPGAEQPVGQLREDAPPAEVRAQSAPPLLESSQRPEWRLTVEGVPCQLPFSFEGVSYSDCHPAGWCCLDPLCARRGACARPEQGSNSTGRAWEPLPLIHPRDEPRAACSLPTVGETPFEWSPTSKAADDTTTVFLLLDADASERREEDFSPLLELAQEPVKFVWLSYSTDEGEVERLMLRMQSRLEEAIRNASASASQDGQVLTTSGRQVDATQGRFFFARTPAWYMSLQSCWLPSVVHAWSHMRAVVTVMLQGGQSPGSVLLRTAANGVKGSWAPSWEADTAKGVAGDLRWFGLACGEQEEEGDPVPVSDVRGRVALVRRGRCSFYRKVRRAQDAGALAVVIFSTDDSPIRMGCSAPDPCEEEALEIPAVMVDHTIGQALLEKLNASSQELLAQIAGERRGPAHVALRGGGGGVHAFGSVRGGLRGVAREVLGLERERRLAARRSEMEAQAAAGAGAAVVEVFTRQLLAGSLVAPWPSERAAALRDQQYDSLELELRLDCKDHLDKNCGPWDFEIDLYLCGPAKRKCRDRAANLGRWITPYGREARWLSNATAALPLLLGLGADSDSRQGGFLHMRSNWWQTYTVTLSLWFRRAAPAAARGPALARVPLWRGGRFDESYNKAQQPHTFGVPADASRAVLSVLLSGHGWGIEEANCAEFCNHSHHFRLNGREQVVKAFPEAGTGDACGSRVARGVVPNQYGTWTFGRAGWCPGMPVEWWEADVTSLLLHGGLPNVITYRALFNGTDYAPVPAEDGNDNGYAAEIHLASFLTFYGSAPALDGAAGRPRAPAGRRQPVLLL